MTDRCKRADDVRRRYRRRPLLAAPTAHALQRLSRARPGVRSRRHITAAVCNASAASAKNALDRLFAFWFGRFVYNQIWEDPRVDLAALELGPGNRLVTIASGGCNVLNYLLADPANRALYYERLRPALDPETRRFWEYRSWLGKRRQDRPQAQQRSV